MNLISITLNYIMKEKVNILKDEKVKLIKQKQGNKFNGYIFLTGPGVLRYKEYVR